MYMKKTILYVLAYCFIANISAQDTVRYGDPWYLFNVQPNVPVFDYDPSVWSPTFMRGFYFGATYALQPYVAPSTGEHSLIYGIALTHSALSVDSINHILGLYRLGQRRPDVVHPDITLSYASFETIDTISVDDAIVRECRFGYWKGDGHEYQSNCYELYFDHPVPVSDTFYIGIVHAPKGDDWNMGITGGYDTSASQTWWLGLSLDNMETYITNNHSGRWVHYRWGSAFPIVRPRCTAPKEGEVIRVEGDSVVIQFVDDGEEHQYEVVYARDGFGVDTTAGERTAAPDSLFTFRGLEAGMRYWYRVRRSCTIGNMTVWSPWSPGYRLPATVGIRPDMEPVALEVKPNPANEYVEVTAEVPEGSLELRDAQGRLHLSQRIEGGLARIELQGVPAGVYTLQLRSAEGNATRRVVVY